MYRIFDLTLSSELPLAGLLASAGGAADLTVAMGASAPAGGVPWEWIHEWKNPHGEVTLSCAKRGQDYLLQAPGTADFHIDFRAARIVVHPLPGAAEGTLAQLLVDQVIPRLLFHRGRLVVHASAVTLGEAMSVAFLGCSRRGKSTLAASFQQHGAALLTDDCLLLEMRGPGVVGIPAYPALRLWPDSATALYGDRQRVDSTALQSGKIRVAARTQRQAAQAPPFSALFILGDPRLLASGDVAIEPLAGRPAMMAMIESAFVLDLVGKDAVRNNFVQVAKLAQCGLPVFSLNYPRHYDRLPRVREAVMETVSACPR